MFRWLCSHPAMVRVYVLGTWYFSCECGYRTPIMRRDPPKAPHAE